MRILLSRLAILAFVCAAVAGSGQASPPPEHPKKIWYNEDVERLRPDWRPEPVLSLSMGQDQPALMGTPHLVREEVAVTSAPVPISSESETKAEQETTVEPKIAPEPPDRRAQPDFWQKEMAPLQAELGQVEDLMGRIQRTRATGEGISNGVNLLDNSSRLSPENQIQLLGQRRAQLLQKISDLEDEARRANIPPGWLRQTLAS